MYKIIQFKLSFWAIIILILSPIFVTAGEITPELQSVLDSTGAQEKVAVIIQLKTQVDRKQFRKFSRKLRRIKLVQKLKQQAKVNHPALRSYLQSNGGKDMRSLWIINSFAVKAKPAVIKKIADRPEVQGIRLDITVPLISDTGSAISVVPWNLAMLDADLVWAQGYEGQGVVVASMDSGVDINHAALSGNWRGGSNSWYDPNNEHNVPYDPFGHGTQTMGIMVGQSFDQTIIGMAPKAQWIAVKIFDDVGNASYSAIHAGFQWLLDPDGDENTDDAPDIVNNSWGYPNTINTCQTEFQKDIQTLRALDINVVFAAGNQEGDAGAASSISPANNIGAFAVGAVEQSGTIASFSNQGPSACGGGIYPAAVAPGYQVSTADLTTGGSHPTATKLVDGTSFAAPHVSGAMALLLSSNPNLTPDDLESAITKSSTDRGEPGADNVYGYGLVNVANALAYLTSVAQCSDADTCAPTILSVTATPVSATLGNVTLTWGDVAGEIKYRVEWSTDNFATRTGVDVAANSTTFTTPNLPGGTLSIQGSRAVRDRVEGSSPVDVTIPTIVAPTIVSATATPVSATLGNVTLTWGDVAGEIKYRVEWSTDNFVTRIGRVVAANATTFTTPNIPGGAYQFRVVAQYRDRVAGSSPVDVTIPTTVAPTIVSATATPVSATLGNVTLTWGDVAGEIKYRVEWSTDNFATRIGRLSRPMQQLSPPRTYLADLINSGYCAVRDRWMVRHQLM